MQSRNKKGQFDRKSTKNRKVHSIRVTDEIWEKFGQMASERSITRADLLEQIVNNNIFISDDRIILLKDALQMKANAGGAIKKKIREFLSLNN